MRFLCSPTPCFHLKNQLSIKRKIPTFTRRKLITSQQNDIRYTINALNITLAPTRPDSTQTITYTPQRQDKLPCRCSKPPLRKTKQMNLSSSLQLPQYKATKNTLIKVPELSVWPLKYSENNKHEKNVPYALFYFT